MMSRVASGVGCGVTSPEMQLVVATWTSTAGIGPLATLSMVIAVKSPHHYTVQVREHKVPSGV